jgi:hypothetical protein
VLVDAEEELPRGVVAYPHYKTPVQGLLGGAQRRMLSRCWAVGKSYQAQIREMASCGLVMGTRKLRCSQGVRVGHMVGV